MKKSHVLVVFFPSFCNKALFDEPMRFDLSLKRLHFAVITLYFIEYNHTNCINVFLVANYLNELKSYSYITLYYI